MSLAGLVGADHAFYYERARVLLPFRTGARTYLGETAYTLDEVGAADFKRRSPPANGRRMIVSKIKTRVALQGCCSRRILIRRAIRAPLRRITKPLLQRCSSYLERAMGLMLLDISCAAPLVCEALPDVSHL